MQPDLNGRTALVTGASRGIGKSIGSALARAGAHVVLLARSSGDLEENKKQIEDAGGSAETFTADLSDIEQTRAVFGHLTESGRGLHILVNNAALGLWGMFNDFPIEDLDRVLAVNVRAAYLCCQEALRIMVPAGGGFIFNIASVVGFKGYPNQSAYTASKHAVMGMTKSLAAETRGQGVFVSAISPGGVDTDLARDVRPDLDRSQLILPEDIALTILYLLSLSERAWVDHVYIRRRSGTPF